MRPQKVLHVVGRMNRGGVEVWLMHVFRSADPAVVQHSVGVHSGDPGAFDPELRELGIPLVHLGNQRALPTYAVRLYRLLRSGRYDVVHSHTSRFSGMVLAIAALAGVKVRIAHCHNSYEAATPSRPGRYLYERLMDVLLFRAATHGLATTHPAGEALFGRHYDRDPRFTRLQYGFDFERYAALPDRARAKSNLGLSPDMKVMGHVGRFDPVKNHEHLVRVFSEVVRRDGSENWRLLLVGDGSLRPSIEDLAEKEGVRQLCVFAGLQADPAPYFRAMDVFVLPSFREGFAIVALEAQAAGVPCLLSAGVPTEVATNVPSSFLPLEAGASAWADRALELSAAVVSTDEALTDVKRRFGIDVCLRRLGIVYEGRPLTDD